MYWKLMKPNYWNSVYRSVFGEIKNQIIFKKVVLHPLSKDKIIKWKNYLFPSQIKAHQKFCILVNEKLKSHEPFGSAVANKVFFLHNNYRNNFCFIKFTKYYFLLVLSLFCRLCCILWLTQITISILLIHTDSVDYAAFCDWPK